MTATTNTTTKRSLTIQQLHILTTLYKFRYLTADLITQSQQAKHKRVILARLKILVDQQYIGMRYDKSYRLQGKPASYYLLPGGIQVLRKQPFADPNVLKRAYYDKNKDDAHVQHRLNVFKAYVYIKQHYPNTFLFYSKSEIAIWKYIPLELCDAYLKRNIDIAAMNMRLTAPQYVLSYFEADMPMWRVKNSVRKYINFAESDQDLPPVLIICENSNQEQRIQKLINRELDSTGALVDFVTLVINP
jgi:hypothetical protein